MASMPMQATSSEWAMGSTTAARGRRQSSWWSRGSLFWMRNCWVSATSERGTTSPLLDSSTATDAVSVAWRPEPYPLVRTSLSPGSTNTSGAKTRPRGAELLASANP